MAGEEIAAGDGVAFSYHAVQPLASLEDDDNLLLETLSSQQRHDINSSPRSGIEDTDNHNSVIFRRVIDDHDNPSSSLTAVEDEEMEYLSLLPDEGDGNGEDVNGEDGPTVAVAGTSSVEQTPREVSLDAPWLRRGLGRGRPLRSHLLELHQEIVNFCKLISPTPEEHQLRAAAVERVAKVVKSIWKQCQVKVFGSFATGLYLPSSDIDVVILDSGCSDIQSGLRALAKALVKNSIAKNLQVIGKARVPIVKFIDTRSLIAFDISFDVQNGPDAAKFIKDAVCAIPPLKPLCLVLKIFLQQRELNEVYTGGIGSYALLVMLLTFLQTRSTRLGFGSSSDPNTLDHNLGLLLVEFLELYGRSLNIKDVGISCRNGGRFFKKKERGFYDAKRPQLLSVEDPQAPNNDIAKNSFNFQKVRYAFMLAHHLLTAVNASERQLQDGLLARIIRVDEKLAGRKMHEGSRDALYGTAEEHDFPRGGVEDGHKKGGRGSSKRKRNSWIYELEEEEDFEDRRSRKKRKEHKYKQSISKYEARRHRRH